MTLNEKKQPLNVIERNLIPYTTFSLPVYFINF